MQLGEEHTIDVAPYKSGVGVKREGMDQVQRLVVLGGSGASEGKLWHLVDTQMFRNSCSATIEDKKGEFDFTTIPFPYKLPRDDYPAIDLWRNVQRLVY